MSLPENSPEFDDLARLRARARTLSIFEGMLQAAMVGLSESYLSALAVQLGHGDSHLALLATLPLLIGALSQLLTGPLASALGSYKRLVLASATVQALSHVSFVFIALRGEQALLPLLSTQVLFWAAGSVISPAWGAWMAELTEDTRRERYFAWRSGLGQLALLLSFSIGGVVLRGAQVRGETLQAFALLLSLGLGARLLSAGVFVAQLSDRAPIPWRGMSTRLRLALRNGQWRVPIYMGALMFGAHLSIPFFTPYMLRTLQLDFGQYALLTSVAILTKVVVFPLFHPLSERMKLPSVLLFAGVGASATPVAWAMEPGFHGLIAAQVLSGAAWAGVEYASFQLLIQAAGSECRGEFLSLANSFSGAMQLAGAVAGSRLLEGLHLEYVEVFLISAGFRAVALTLLVVSTRTLTFPIRLPRLIFRLRAVRPTTGAMREPVLREIPDEKPETNHS